jgi:hypothetical protein
MAQTVGRILNEVCTYSRGYRNFTTAAPCHLYDRHTRTRGTVCLNNGGGRRRGTDGGAVRRRGGSTRAYLYICIPGGRSHRRRPRKAAAHAGGSQGQR